MTDAENTLDISIKTPLPSSVVLTLGAMINAAWPGAELAAGDGYNRNQVIFRIRNAPARPVSDDEVEALVVPSDPDGDVDIYNLGPGGVGMSTPTDVAAALLPVLESSFAEFPDAENYLEMPIHNPETGKRYLLTFCRSARQSPHALRIAAEEKLETARQDVVDVQMRAVQRLLTGLRPAEATSYEDGVRAALEAMRAVNFGRRGA